MASYRVKLKGAAKIWEFEAATFEEVSNPLDPFAPADRIAKDANGKEIARFVGKEIAGWSIEADVKPITHTIRFAKPGDDQEEKPSEPKPE